MLTAAHRILRLACWCLAIGWVPLSGFAEARSTADAATMLPAEWLVRQKLNVGPAIDRGAAVGRVGSWWVIAGGVTADGAVSDRFLASRDNGASWDVRRLPRPNAFAGVSVAPGELLLVGGRDSVGASADVVVITEREGQLHIDHLPPLPEPREAPAVGRVFRQLVVWGGKTTEGRVAATEFVLTGQTWSQNRPIPPEAARVGAVLVGVEDEVWILGGETGDGSPLASAAVVRWSREQHRLLREIGGGIGGRVTAAPAGTAHYAVSGAGETAFFHLLAQRWVHPPAEHFPSAGVWAAAPRGSAAIRASATETGETMWETLFVPTSRSRFSGLDYAVVVVYLAAMLAIGLSFSRRQKDTDEFFVGGRNIPWWAAGMSVYATGTSAISFMAIPAKTFATDMLYFTQLFFTIPLGYLAARALVPVLRRLRVTTIYEFLGLRFGRPVRVMGGVIFLVFQVAARASIVIYLPALAISYVAGISLPVSIFLMGAVTTVYTMYGGIEAVVWTDVAQVIVMFGGALLVVAIILFSLNDPAEAWIAVQQFEKMRVVVWSWEVTIPSVFVGFLLGLNAVLTVPADQSLMQRVFGTKDEQAAKRSLYTHFTLAIPGSLLFYGLGVLLFAFYHERPAALPPGLANDNIFPFFIVQELPMGISGLLVAGLLAAAMSTLSSALNSSAAVFVRDIYSLFVPTAPEARKMRLAVVTTVSVGVFGTGVALLMSQFEIMSLWDMSMRLTAWITGGFPAVVALGLLTRRASGPGVIIGLLGSIVITITYQYTISSTVLILAPVAAFSSLTLGYVASLFLPDRARPLQGLTVHDTAFAQR